jgi:hypothetical protein
MTTWTIFADPPVGGLVVVWAGPPAVAVGDVDVDVEGEAADVDGEADESGVPVEEHPTSAATVTTPATSPYTRTWPCVMWRIGRVFPHLV